VSKIDDLEEVYGEVTQAGLDRLLERKGVPRTERGSMMRRDGAERMSVSRELITRMTYGIADRNPLYVDEEYAARSIWGRLLCPPGILSWAEVVNGATDGFPGCHTIWRGCELEWERPIFVGDRINSVSYLADARLAESKFGGGQAAIQDYETKSETGDGEVIGYYRTSWHRFSRLKAKGAKKYADSERPQWTDEELEAVWEEYRTHNLANRRGDVPLYWEDVEVGTDIPHIVKGPTTLTSKWAFESMGGPGGWIVGHELMLDLMQQHPGLHIRNEENVPEPPVAIHWTNERCQKYLGMPAAYEAGYERLNWLTQLLMSWMGDHGMLRKLSIRFKGFHWQGDLVRLHATVTGKREEGGRRLVDLDISTRTHRDEVTTKGSAVVQLPGKGGAPVWPPS